MALVCEVKVYVFSDVNVEKSLSQFAGIEKWRQVLFQVFIASADQLGVELGVLVVELCASEHEWVQGEGGTSTDGHRLEALSKESENTRHFCKVYIIVLF